jgi:hypothetical protein
MLTYSVPFLLAERHRAVKYCIGVGDNKHGHIRLSADLDFPAVLYPAEAVTYACARTIVEVGRGSSERPASCLLWRGTLHDLVGNAIEPGKSLGSNRQFYVNVAPDASDAPWWEDLGGLDLLDAQANINVSILHNHTYGVGAWTIHIRGQSP